jgi:hypothetical protein
MYMDKFKYYELHEVRPHPRNRLHVSHTDHVTLVEGRGVEEQELSGEVED